MPPQLAALLTWTFVLCLLWRDVRARPETRPGLWVATIWFIILASRVPSYWFQSGGSDISVAAFEEGNSFNQVAYSILEIAGLLVLMRRRVPWLELARRNQVLCLFLGFTFVSFLWADYPFVSFKGSVKAVVGNVVMALVILTDPSPAEAIRSVIRRCAIVVLPLSVMAIKWFPAIGRETHRYSDATLYTGIATGSNGLSTACFVCGLVLVWELIRRGALEDKKEFAVNATLFGMALWLFTKGDGATAVGGMILGTTMLMLLRLRVFGSTVMALGRNVGIILLLLTPVVVINYAWFLDTAGGLFGRTATIWGRLELWGRVVAMVDNPLLGAGYNSFWQGERMASLWSVYWWNPTQAHNGYVETYLNLGWIGIALLVAVIIVAGRRSGDRRLQTELLYLRSPYIVPILLFNLTEAAFRGLHVMWFVFLLMTIETRQQLRAEERLPVDEPAPAPPRVVASRWRPAAEAVMAGAVRRWDPGVLTSGPVTSRAAAHSRWGLANGAKSGSPRRG